MLYQAHGDKNYAEEFFNKIRHSKNSYIMSETYDIREEIKQIDCPVFIVNGDRDYYFNVFQPLEIYEMLKRKAKLWIAPGVGHDVHLESPNYFVSYLLDFLKD